MIGTGLAGFAPFTPSSEAAIRVEAFESLTRLAAALSLLAAFKIGRGSSVPRWRLRRARIARSPAPGRAIRSAPRAVPDPSPRSRPRFSLHSLVAAAWIITSLIVLAYAAIEGERALAAMDGFDLLAIYSSLPLIQP